MPIVTVNGSAKLNWDIKYDRFDPKTGEMSQEGNRLKQLDLTEGEKFDFQPNGAKMKEIVWRGQPNPSKMCWNEMPVFRVLTHRFKTGFKQLADPAEMAKTDWARFMRDYDRQKRDGSYMFFEPHIEDIRLDPDTNFAFPMWVIDKLIEDGEFEQSLKLNKVNLPGTVRLTKAEYDRIMKEIELRREAETPKEAKTVGNLQGNLKPSASKAS